MKFYTHANAFSNALFSAKTISKYCVTISKIVLTIISFIRNIKYLSHLLKNNLDKPPS